MAKKPAKQDGTGRDAKGRYPKGVSGNPDGRPRLDDAFSQKIRDTEGGNLETGLKRLWEKAGRGDLQAMAWLKDNGWGKSPQPISGPDGGPHTIIVERRG
jgi:hypothetical protein